MDQGLILLGLILIAAGLVVGSIGLFRGASSGKVRGGGVIIVGPFPIVFGSDSSTARSLLILAIVLVVLLIGYFLLQLIV